MTVNELIAKLSAYDGEEVVFVGDSISEWGIANVVFKEHVEAESIGFIEAVIIAS